MDRSTLQALRSQAQEDLQDAMDENVALTDAMTYSLQRHQVAQGVRAGAKDGFDGQRSALAKAGKDLAQSVYDELTRDIKDQEEASDKEHAKTEADCKAAAEKAVEAVNEKRRQVRVLEGQVAFYDRVLLRHPKIEAKAETPSVNAE